MFAKPCALTFCVQCGTAGTERALNGKLKANPANKKLAVQVKELLATQHPTEAAQIAVRLSRCQGACASPCAWQLAGVGKESLQWGHGCTELAPEIATAAAQYANLAPHQKLTKAIFPAALRGKLLARLFPWPKPKGYR